MNFISPNPDLPHSVLETIFVAIFAVLWIFFLLAFFCHSAREWYRTATRRIPHCDDPEFFIEETKEQKEILLKAVQQDLQNHPLEIN